jgi:hypothetical protein
MITNDFIIRKSYGISATYCMYNVIHGLNSAGWNIIAWSDATTAKLTGTIPGPYATGSTVDPIYPMTGTFQNSGSSGANGLSNTNAWVLLRQPKGSGSHGYYDGKRQICIQRGSQDYSWRIKYSASGTFNLDTATNIRTPFSTDQVFLCGSGSDSSPSYANIFDTSGRSSYSTHYVVASTGSSDNRNPYGFIAISFAHPAQQYAHFAFMFDPMLSGTSNAKDYDPFVFYVDKSQTSFKELTANSFNSDSGVVTCWFRYGLGSNLNEFGPVIAASYAANINAATNCFLPANTNTVYNAGYDCYLTSSQPVPQLYDITYIRPNFAGYTTCGNKGISSMLKWNSYPIYIGETFSVDDTNDRMSLNTISHIWDGTEAKI